MSNKSQHLNFILSNQASKTPKYLPWKFKNFESTNVCIFSCRTTVTASIFLLFDKSKNSYDRCMLAPGVPLNVFFFLPPWNRTKPAVCPSSAARRNGLPSRGRCLDSRRCSRKNTGWKETEAQRRRRNVEGEVTRPASSSLPKINPDGTRLLLIRSSAKLPGPLHDMCAHPAQTIFIEILRPFMTFILKLHFIDVLRWTGGCHISFNLRSHGGPTVFTSVYQRESAGWLIKWFRQDFYEDERDMWTWVTLYLWKLQCISASWDSNASLNTAADWFG